MSYALYKQPYFDPVAKLYINVISISSMPVGPLSKHVRRLRIGKLSAYNDELVTCKLAITYNNCLATYDDLPWLIAFLQSNGYRVETRLTEIVKDDHLIFYITYTHTAGA
jgi:hypothetical protein